VVTFTPSFRGGSGSPLVCLHGFTDTWRTWELVLPELERRHDVLAPTLAGHAGGPPLGEASDAALADAVGGEIAAAPGSERLERDPVAEPFDEDERTLGHRAVNPRISCAASGGTSSCGQRGTGGR